MAIETRELEIPVEGVDGGELYDSYADAGGPRRHQAIDIMAPHGCALRAA